MSAEDRAHLITNIEQLIRLKLYDELADCVYDELADCDEFVDDDLDEPVDPLELWLDLLERLDTLPDEKLEELETSLCAHMRPDEFADWERMSHNASTPIEQLLAVARRIGEEQRARRAAALTARRSTACRRRARRPVPRHRGHRRSIRRAAARRAAGDRAGSDPGDPEPAGIDGGAR